MGIESALASLLGSLAADGASGVEQAILALSSIHCEYEQVPDRVVERLLTLLRNEKMYHSPLSGYMLNFFEFEAPHLTPRPKSLYLGFLPAHGHEFTHFHGRQVVEELQRGPYLR